MYWWLDTQKGKRRVAWKEHLIKSPSGPQFPHLSDGFPPSASIILRSHPRVPEVALGARPEDSLGLGVGSLKASSPVMGRSATEIHCFHLRRGGGFLWFLSPANRKLWSGAVLTSCSCSPARACVEVPRHAWRRGVGWGDWGGGCSEVNSLGGTEA